MGTVDRRALVAGVLELACAWAGLLPLPHLGAAEIAAGLLVVGGSLLLVRLRSA
ncbi:MAG: hypothetical protein AB7Q97_22850 [Gammaproteobacteria bacterium]